MNENIKNTLHELRVHLMTGVSYMIPVVVIGGLLLSAAVAIGGTDVGQANGTFAALLRDIGIYGLQLIVPVIAAYISYSIADKPGIAPALILGTFAYKMGTGFLGGIIIGILVGYVVELLKKALFRLPEVILPAISILVIPVGAALIGGILLNYVIGAPIVALQQGLTTWLHGMSAGNAIILSAILGAMMAFDMGGPINKVALTFALAAFEQKEYAISSAANIAISVPPLGLALATFIAAKKYTQSEREAAKSAAIMGLIGITEGAIPFAVADPVRVIPSIMIGTAVTSGLACALGVINPTIMAFLFATPFVNTPVLHVGSVLVGCVVTALLVNLLKPNIKEEQEDSIRA